MSSGTPGFIGRRLKQVREARLLTGIALAELVGVTPASITQYEKGKQKPTPDTLQRLASVLNVEPAFFTRPMPDDEPASAVFWRSAASATAAARRRAQSRYDWLREIVDVLRTFMELPRVHFPPAVVSSDPSRLDTAEIERLAVEARRFWGLGYGAISDVTLLLENNGAVVARGELAAHTLDAFSQWRWRSNVPYLFFGTEKDSAARHRFNVAHELGHLLLHRYVPQVKIGRMEQHALVEQQANRFAGAFLLPAERFQDMLYAPTLDAMLALKAQVNVSVGLMIHRVSDLGMASDEHTKRLWMNYTRRRWRSHEPLDGEIPVERPRLLRRAVEMLVQSGVQSKAQFRGRFGLPASDLEDLVGLPRGYLSDTPPEPRLLHFPTSRPPQQGEIKGERPGNGRVIPFPSNRKQG
ncbi:MAG TPA: XRE family transcriptional regulator [Longimicrobiaceae bacterium]|nr:XRE family transcriptional regulator [Longimicrobiaceae bacterium]